jgi:hypothetical protein
MQQQQPQHEQQAVGYPQTNSWEGMVHSGSIGQYYHHQQQQAASRLSSAGPGWNNQEQGWYPEPGPFPEATFILGPTSTHNHINDHHHQQQQYGSAGWMGTHPPSQIGPGSGYNQEDQVPASWQDVQDLHISSTIASSYSGQRSGRPAALVSGLSMNSDGGIDSHGTNVNQTQWQDYASAAYAWAPNNSLQVQPVSPVGSDSGVQPMVGDGARIVCSWAASTAAAAPGGAGVLLSPFDGTSLLEQTHMEVGRQEEYEAVVELPKKYPSSLERKEVAGQQQHQQHQHQHQQQQLQLAQQQQQEQLQLQQHDGQLVVQGEGGIEGKEAHTLNVNPHCLRGD